MTTSKTSKNSGDITFQYNEVMQENLFLKNIVVSLSDKVSNMELLLNSLNIDSKSSGQIRQNLYSIFLLYSEIIEKLYQSITDDKLKREIDQETNILSNLVKFLSDNLINLEKISQKLEGMTQKTNLA
jgi:hypothetical protein